MQKFCCLYKANNLQNMQWKTMAPKFSIAKFLCNNQQNTHTHTQNLHFHSQKKLRCSIGVPPLFPVSRHIFGGQFGSRYAEKSNDKRVMQHQHVWHCWSLFRIIHSGTESWAASSESSFYLVAMERASRDSSSSLQRVRPSIYTNTFNVQLETHRGEETKIGFSHATQSSVRTCSSSNTYRIFVVSCPFRDISRAPTESFQKLSITPETKEKGKQKIREEDDELLQKIKRKLFKPLLPHFSSKQTLYLLQFLSVWNDLKNCGSAN